MLVVYNIPYLSYRDIGKLRRNVISCVTEMVAFKLIFV